MAKKLAQWAEDGGVPDVSSMDTVKESMFLARSALQEVFDGCKHVKDRLVKIAITIDTMEEEEANGRVEESDTSFLDAQQKLEEIFEQVKSAGAFFESGKRDLEIASKGWSDPSEPGLAKGLKAFMEDMLRIVKTNLRLIKQLDKMMDWSFGPLAA